MRFFLHFGASDFPSKNSFKNVSKSPFFSLWHQDPVLKLQIPTPLRVVLLCFATHIVMAASRLLPASAVCVILLSFAAGLRKSYWSGCMKAATVICQQIFSILALVIFLLKILLKSAAKSFFFALASRSGFGATISDAVARRSIVFCNSASADRIVMAASRLLRAVAALCCIRNIIVFCSSTS